MQSSLIVWVRKSTYLDEGKEMNYTLLTQNNYICVQLRTRTLPARPIQIRFYFACYVYEFRTICFAI